MASSRSKYVERRLRKELTFSGIFQEEPACFQGLLRSGLYSRGEAYAVRGATPEGDVSMRAMVGGIVVVVVGLILVVMMTAARAPSVPAAHPPRAA